MDHRDVISGIEPEALAGLSQRSDLCGLLHLTGHVGLIVLGAIWILQGWVGWPVIMVLHGIALVFLFTLEHEATHKTPFANERLNEWAGRYCGLLIVLPFEWFRYFHLAHHKYTNDPARDPELLAGAKPEGWAGFVWYASGLPYWGGMIAQVLSTAMGRDQGAYVPTRAIPRLRSEARWMIAVYLLAALSLMLSPFLLWIWIVPMLLGQPFLRLYLLAEHGRCAFVANMLENTRTTFTNRLVRFLAWNMPYHIEHHTLPNVPFHQLPKLHAHMQLSLGVTAPSYRKFVADYARGLR